MKKDNQENQSRFAQAQLTDNFSFFVDSKKLDLSKYKEKPIIKQTKKKKRRGIRRRADSDDSLNSVATGMTGLSEMTGITSATGLT